jgi:hypothetical protein
MQTTRYLAAALVVLTAAGVSAGAGPRSSSPTAAAHAGETVVGAMTGQHHEHGSPTVAITFAELQETAQALAAARQATKKYLDVRAAEAAGYRAVGPSVPGMGIHYVRRAEHRHFSITEPPILLYERDAVAGGLRLIGVSYLFVSPGDADGQPTNPPFPKSLANWHKHNNICILPDDSTSVDLSEAQCTARRGQFTAETSWMVHAWIWKESPAGVFSPTNPLVK